MFLAMTEFLNRVNSEKNEPVLNRSVNEKVVCEGEFDRVVPCMDDLLQEFMICQCFLDVNWTVAYKAFALSQGYHGDRQLKNIQSGKDHHNT